MTFDYGGSYYEKEDNLPTQCKLTTFNSNKASFDSESDMKRQKISSSMRKQENMDVESVSYNTDKLDDEFTEIKRIRCLCNSFNCKGFLPLHHG